MMDSYALHVASMAASWLASVGAGIWAVRWWTGRRGLPRPSWLISGGIAAAGLASYLFLKFQFTSARTVRSVSSELEDVGLAMLGSWGLLQFLALAALLWRGDEPWPRRRGVAVPWALGLFLPLTITWSAGHVWQGLAHIINLYL